MSDALITVETEKLNAALKSYSGLIKKSVPDILAKKGGSLAFALLQRAKALAPAKGSIRASRLAALLAGEGVRVRPRVVQAILAKYGAHSAVDTRQLRFFRGKKSVASINRKGKRLNLRALMVQRELSTRESGRGFLSVSSRYPRMLAAAQEARSKFGPAISSARLESKGSESSATILWDGTRGELPASAAEGLLKPRGRAAIGLALRDVTSDTLDYVQRKLGESAKAARLK